MSERHIGKYVASLRHDGTVNLSTVIGGKITASEDFNSRPEAMEILETDRAYFYRIYSRALKAAGIFATALGAVTVFEGTKDASKRLQAAGAISAGLGSLSAIGSILSKDKVTELGIQREIIGDLTPADPNSSFLLK